MEVDNNEGALLQKGILVQRNIKDSLIFLNVKICYKLQLRSIIY